MINVNLLVCRFSKRVLGYAALNNVSMFEIAARALEKVGKKRSGKPREFVLAHLDFMLEYIGATTADVKLSNRHLRQIRRQEKKNRAVNKPPPRYINPNTDAFLDSYEWRRVRMEALKLHGARCQCCGATPSDGLRMHVDHIKPRRLFPNLALDLTNLQVLCEVCNHGKGNWDTTDWRPAPVDSSAEEWMAHMRDISLGED